jgi:CRISPR/Cas system CMR-associated protein Cmr5 small subunit
VVLREWLDYATDRVPRMQEAKIKEGRGLKHTVAFVEGDEKVDDVDKRSVQRPRVFYRREPESQPMVVAKP